MLVNVAAHHITMQAPWVDDSRDISVRTIAVTQLATHHSRATTSPHIGNPRTILFAPPPPESASLVRADMSPTLRSPTNLAAFSSAKGQQREPRPRFCEMFESCMMDGQHPHEIPDVQAPPA